MPIHRHLIQWPAEAWPGAAQKEFELLSQHLRWQRSRFDPDDGTAGSAPGGHPEPTGARLQPDDVPSTRTWIIDANAARDRPTMEYTKAK